jgi:hypothetical protein
MPGERVVIPNGCEGSKIDFSLPFETRISPGVYPEYCRRGRNDREANGHDVFDTATQSLGKVRKGRFGWNGAGVMWRIFEIGLWR